MFWHLVSDGELLYCNEGDAVKSGASEIIGHAPTAAHGIARLAVILARVRGSQGLYKSVGVVTHCPSSFSSIKILVFWVSLARSRRMSHGL